VSRSVEPAAARSSLTRNGIVSIRSLRTPARSVRAAKAETCSFMRVQLVNHIADVADYILARVRILVNRRASCINIRADAMSGETRQ
jgi:hypothetical protein